MKRLLYLIIFALFLVGAGSLFSDAKAGPYFYGGRGYGYGGGAPYYSNGPAYPYYYGQPYIGPNAVVIDQRPVIIERQGAYDQLYQYDNVYGPGASAAGRMSRSVVNPQPQFFYAY